MHSIYRRKIKKYCLVWGVYFQSSCLMFPMGGGPAQVWPLCAPSISLPRGRQTHSVMGRLGMSVQPLQLAHRGSALLSLQCELFLCKGQRGKDSCVALLTSLWDNMVKTCSFTRPTSKLGSRGLATPHSAHPSPPWNTCSPCQPYQEIRSQC